MRSLSYLDLSCNSVQPMTFTGAVPVGYSQLTALTYLSLANQL